MGLRIGCAWAILPHRLYVNKPPIDNYLMILLPPCRGVNDNKIFLVLTGQI
jgi:hypothetical protein